jgi:hypothetical protein
LYRSWFDQGSTAVVILCSQAHQNPGTNPRIPPPPQPPPIMDSNSAAAWTAAQNQEASPPREPGANDIFCGTPQQGDSDHHQQQHQQPPVCVAATSPPPTRMMLIPVPAGSPTTSQQQHCNYSIPQTFRHDVRTGRFEPPCPTNGICPGYLQCNLVVLPAVGPYAFDFLLFCQRNPQACPLLEVCCDNDNDNVDDEEEEQVEMGPAATRSFLSRTLARGADLRTDLPKYVQLF